MMTAHNGFANDLRRQLEEQRAHLTTWYQRVGVALQPGESAPLEAQIRELHEQISAQTGLVSNLTIERSDLMRDLARTRRQLEAQDKDVAEAQFEQTSFITSSAISSPRFSACRAGYIRAGRLWNGRTDVQFWSDVKPRVQSPAVSFSRIKNSD
jgi:hypothetical protein